MKKFSTSRDGFDKQEVSDFVREVTYEYESMLNKLKSRDNELLVLRQELSHYKEIEKTLNQAVLVAEDSSNQIKRIAKEEANNIIETAKKNASHIVNDALLKAQKIDMDADQLRRSLKIYKARIKATIKEQLTMVDDIDEIEEV